MVPQWAHFICSVIHKRTHRKMTTSSIEGSKKRLSPNYLDIIPQWTHIIPPWTHFNLQCMHKHTHRKMTTSSGSFLSLDLMKRSRCFWCMQAEWCTCVSTCAGGGVRGAGGWLRGAWACGAGGGGGGVAVRRKRARGALVPLHFQTRVKRRQVENIPPAKRTNHLADVVEVAVRRRLLSQELLVCGRPERGCVCVKRGGFAAGDNKWGQVL